MVDDDKGKPSSSWNGRRHFIALAALGGTVVATAVVITISVVLRPVHMEFAVERATRDMTNVRGNNTAIYLNMTVTARSTSGQGRAMVKYHSLLVYLEAISSTKTETYRTSLETALPGDYLEAGAGTPATSINTSLLLVGKSLTNSIPAEQLNKTGNITVNVVVISSHWFKIGLVHTGLYNAVVRCPRVRFHPINYTDATPINCTG